MRCYAALILRRAFQHKHARTLLAPDSARTAPRAAAKHHNVVMAHSFVALPRYNFVT